MRDPPGARFFETCGSRGAGAFTSMQPPSANFPLQRHNAVYATSVIVITS